MRLLSTFLFACIFGTTNAYYSRPFISKPAKLGPYYNLNLFSTLNVGTPGQEVEVRLKLDGIDEGSPGFLYGKTCTSGIFDFYSSTTFLVQDFTKFGGAKEISGYDTINLDNGQTQPNVTMSIYWPAKYCDDFSSIVSFGLHTGGNPSFIRDFLQTQSNPIAVFAFKEVGSNGTQPASGTIVLGDYAKDLCANDWKYMSSFLEDNGSINDWAVKVDRIDFVKYSKVNPGNLTFSLDNFSVMLPEPAYSNVIRILGVDDNKMVDCNVQKFIKLQINGASFTIGPDVYLDLSSKDTDGKCKSHIIGDEGMFELPISFLRSKCISLNYQNGKIGLATSKIAV